MTKVGKVSARERDWVFLLPQFPQFRSGVDLDVHRRFLFRHSKVFQNYRNVILVRQDQKSSNNFFRS